MKQNKRRTATVVYIFIFMLTVSGCVRKGKEQDKVYQETGMFEWSEEAVCEPEEALYLAKELGITKWYQETNGMTEVEATGKFVKALHNRMEQRCWHIWKKSFNIMYNLQKKRSLTELCWI